MGGPRCRRWPAAGRSAMRDRWYGDDPDVVKWSAVVHLARREAIADVLYVYLDPRVRYQ